MSYTLSVRLRCDGERCDHALTWEGVVSAGNGVGDLRRAAKTMGWRFVSARFVDGRWVGGVDLCLFCDLARRSARKRLDEEASA